MQIKGKRILGIYKITNITNHKVYIGQSSNIDKRLKQHRSDLRSGRHENSYLQNAWNKYGEESFIFEVLEECLVDLLTQREQFWADFFRFPDGIYNIGGFVDAPFRGRTHTEATKRLLSKQRKGTCCGEANHFYNKTHSEEVKLIISLSKKGKKHTDIQKENRSKWTSCEGNPAVKLDIDSVLEIKKLYSTGNFTYKEISEIYKVSKSCIAFIIQGRSWTFGVKNEP